MKGAEVRLTSIAALVAASLLMSPSLAAAEPGEGFDVTRYDLALTPNIQDRTVAGREVITLRATADRLQRLSFSSNALSIDTATIDGVPVVVRSRADGLHLDLAKPLARGRSVRLELTYHGRPARGLSGSATALYTSYFACDWMVCVQDRFGDKAAFSLALHVPTGLDTLSVGRRIARRPTPDGGEVHLWAAPRPYSAYLFGFAVGRFARADDRVGPARLTYLSETADAAELKRRFAETGPMVRFLSDKAGVPLPVSEYSQLLVQGREAQEAATYAVLGVDALATKADDPAEDWAIAHELAHQWWGNLVTCATLQDFWLNEGVTTFMTAAWKEHRYGRAAYEAELAVARSRLDKARAAGFDKPLAWEGTYPTLATRRAVQYSKGALFMDHLRTVLGEDAFWAGLRRYTRAHAGGVVTSLDFQRAMEASSGRDLRPVFSEWVFGPAEK
ncbi:aminopeptidase [Caulobacter sp. Root656]|nr:aminopeptidase [Caulobacter sp. Root656]